MPDVDGGFQGCCCGNRGTGGTACRAEDFFLGGGGGILLSMSGSVCLPWALLLYLCNLLQENINEDLELDCHLLSFWNASRGYRSRNKGQQSDTQQEKWCQLHIIPVAALSCSTPAVWSHNFALNNWLLSQQSIPDTTWNKWISALHLMYFAVETQPFNMKCTLYCVYREKHALTTVMVVKYCTIILKYLFHWTIRNNKKIEELFRTTEV